MNGYFYLFYNSDVASIQNLSNKNKKTILGFSYGMYNHVNFECISLFGDITLRKYLIINISKDTSCCHIPIKTKTTRTFEHR